MNLMQGVPEDFDPNKWDHMFENSGHNPRAVIYRAGGEQSTVFYAAERRIRELMDAGVLRNGVFRETVNLFGYDAIVTGNVIDGYLNLSNIWIP